jgi:hypothetical protein
MLTVLVPTKFIVPDTRLAPVFIVTDVFVRVRADVFVEFSSVAISVPSVVFASIEQTEVDNDELPLTLSPHEADAVLGNTPNSKITASIVRNVCALFIFIIQDQIIL